MPFYVSPEQVMKDKADYARKGIARGRPVLVLTYDHGILLVAENPSRALHKISEIYDRVAFAAVGKYNEYENLRVAGVRLADLRGYSYDRRDVTGRGLANAYAQTLGSIFTETNKPYEVELVVAEVGDTPEEDQIYRLTYDGSVGDERGYVVMGGQAEAISAAMAERHRDGLSLSEALGLAVEMLSQDPAGSAAPRELGPAQLEVAVLDRQRPRRTFRRLTGPVLARLLDGSPAEAVQPDSAAPDVPDADFPPGETTDPGGAPTSLAGGAHEPPGPGATAPGDDETGTETPDDTPAEEDPHAGT
jgi:proteasome alpha subunit